MLFNFVLIWHSLYFLRVVFMHSWVLSDEFLLYAISFVWRCFDHLFRFNCWFQMIFSESFTSVSFWFRSNVEPWWHFHLNLWVTLNSFPGLIEILRFSCQLFFGSSISVFAKSISFYCKHVLHWGASVHFLTEIRDEFINTPDHIELFKSELFATIIHNVSFLCQLYVSFLFLKSVPNDEVLKDFSFSFLSWRTFFWWKFLAVLKSFGLMFIAEVWPFYFCSPGQHWIHSQLRVWVFNQLFKV